MKARMPCEKNCKGRILDSGKGIYCRCIESKLPKRNKGSVQAISTDGIERYHQAFEYPDADLTSKEIEASLRRHGLDEYEIKLVMARFVEDLTVKEIVETQGWTNSNSANYYIRSVLLKLRERRFTLK